LKHEEQSRCANNKDYPMGFQSGNFPYKLPKLNNMNLLAPDWTGMSIKKWCFAPTFVSIAQRFRSSNRIQYA
jgi:hypothetical protein